MAKALVRIANQLQEVRELRREFSDTDGAISELNRTPNDMHEKSREDMVKLTRAPTPRSSPRQNKGHICKRWQRFKRPAPKAVIHNGIKTEVVDISTPTNTRVKNKERPEISETVNPFATTKPQARKLSDTARAETHNSTKAIRTDSGQVLVACPAGDR